MRNLSTTTGTVKFVDGNEAIVTSWSRTAKGQHGFDERRYLRDLDPAERRERLRSLCGESGGAEVLVAEAPGIDRPAGDLELRCELERDPGGFDDRIVQYSYGLGGPWFEWLPDYSDDRRVHPIVFRFPKADLGTMTFEAPEGFEPGEPPPPVVLNGRLADYTLTVEKDERAFKVSRSFVLKALVVPPADYGEFRAFLQKVREADRTSVVFRRRGAAR
jgi:hypothetical protein